MKPSLLAGVAIPLVALALLVAVALPRVAFAAGAETITGTVVNGTKGASVPKNVVVTLQGVGQNHQITTNQSTTVDADGHFSFANVPADPAVTYVVSTTYAGVPYLSAVPKANGKATIPVQIEIYETTTSDAAIRIASANWVLGSLDVDKQQTLILETLVVANDGDRVYVGDRRGDPGSAVPAILPRTLRLTLPTGASGFQPEIGLDPAKLLPVAGGFADTAPVLPGQHDVAYTFRIGYAESVAELRVSLPYPTSKLRFLAPDAGLEFRTDRLGDEGTVQIEGHPYRVLGAENLKADTTVTVDVIGLPAVPTSRLSPEDMKVGGIVVIVLAIIFALFVGLRTRASREDDPLAERRELLAAIAQIDDRYAAGQLAVQDYRAARASRKRELIDLIVGERASASGPGVA